MTDGTPHAFARGRDGRVTRRWAAAAAAALVLACGPDGRAPGDASDPADSVARAEVPADTAPAETAPTDTPGPAAGLDTVATWTAGIVQGEGRAGTPSVGDPGAVLEGSAAGTAVLQDVRVERHEDFDRLVLQFAGDRFPGYQLEYVDRPVRECGSGHPVPLPGDGWLSVRLLGARAHTEGGEATIRERERTPTDLGVIEKLVLTCDFEGNVVWVAAVSSPNRYRVLQDREPARLVVDVRH